MYISITVHGESKYSPFSCFVGYVENVKQLLFTLTKPEMTEVYNRYSKKAPKSLSAQFSDRMDKQSAVKAYKEKRAKGSTQLFPTGKIFSFIVF